MMTNSEICKAFVNGTHNGKWNRSLSISDNGDRLFSYNTCIAEKLPNGIIILNATKYSVTTSHHQSIVRKLTGTMEVLFTTKHVPRGTHYLERFI